MLPVFWVPPRIDNPLSIPIFDEYSVTPTSPYLPEVPLPSVSWKGRLIQGVSMGGKGLGLFAAVLHEAARAALGQLSSLRRKEHLIRGLLGWPGLVVELREISWVVALAGYLFVATVVARVSRLVLGGLKSLTVQYKVPKGLDPRHLKTERPEVDVRHVPLAVQVRSLLGVFDEVNFDDKEKAGYWGEKLWDLGDGFLIAPHLVTKENLREKLEKFVKNVEDRVVRVGTPKEWERERLEKFYRRIENIVRFCLHESDKEIRAFKEKEIVWDSNGWPTELNDRMAYDLLLERRARLAIDFAFAAERCGGRYMAQANDFLLSFQGDDLRLPALEETLTEFLASDRAIILREIGNELDAGGSHGLTTIMQAIGKIVGAAEIEGAIEPLPEDFTEAELLPGFFARYTPARILEKVQEKLQKSQEFREQVRDWIRSHVFAWVETSSWKKEVYEEPEASLCVSEHVQKIFGAQVTCSHLDSLEVLWKHREGMNKSLEDGVPWEDAVIANCSSEEVSKRRYLMALSDSFEMERCLTGQDWEEVRKELEAHQREKGKIALLKQVEIDGLGFPFLHMGESSLKELLSEETEENRRNQLIAQGLEFARKTSFFDEVVKCHFSTPQEEESSSSIASPALLEWLLVEHGVFVPQQAGGIAS